MAWRANSVALVADAAHNLGDVLSLLLAWGAAWLTRRPPTARRTYGWGRSSILAALINAAVLLISVGAIGFEAIRRLLDPEPVASGIVMAVAAAGIVVNGGTRPAVHARPGRGPEYQGAVPASGRRRAGFAGGGAGGRW